MMLAGQLDLFTPRDPPKGQPAKPRKRPAYKHTSREAQRSFRPHSGTLDDLILTEIAKAMPQGIICEQIELTINRKHQSVAGNLRHLVEAGWAKDSGQIGKTTSGRKAILWVLTEKGQQRYGVCHGE